ncbi:UNVERIFIED_ORG: hypothetical protein J2Y77_004933 [Pseudomonas lini]
MNQSLKRHEAVGHWLASVGLNLLLPMLPLFVEFAISKSVSSSNLVLAASMYSVTTGVVSKNRLVFIASIIICVFYAAMFGHLLSLDPAKEASSFYASIVLVFLFGTNVIVKFWYHVVELRKYTDFSLGGD